MAMEAYSYINRKFIADSKILLNKIFYYSSIVWNNHQKK